MILTSLTRYRDQGLLLLRVALGAFHIYALGWHLLAGGARRWVELGHAMAHLGIHSGYVFWGFMAAFSQTIGCVLFLLGLFFRPACILLFVTMCVAATTHPNLPTAAHAIELAILFFCMLFIGPGKFSLDKS